MEFDFLVNYLMLIGSPLRRIDDQQELVDFLIQNDVSVMQCDGE
jgi:hypothetical protein